MLNVFYGINTHFFGNRSRFLSININILRIKRFLELVNDFLKLTKDFCISQLFFINPTHFLEYINVFLTALTFTKRHVIVLLQ